MIVNNPTSLDAMQAGRLAQRHYELCQAWKASHNLDVLDAVCAMGDRREDHEARTGWAAYFDGRITTYLYTGPTREDTP